MRALHLKRSHIISKIDEGGSLTVTDYSFASKFVFCPEARLLRVPEQLNQSEFFGKADKLNSNSSLLLL